MAEPLERALTRVRGHLLDERSLVRAVAAGRRRAGSPRWRRAELRYVDLKAGRHLQVTTFDQTQGHTANHAVGEPATQAADALLDEPFGSWHVDTTEATVQVRVTKRGGATVHTTPHEGLSTAPSHEHDRRKGRLLPEDDPVLIALGISDGSGRVKPSRQAKYRQVEELLRALAAALDDTPLRQVTAADPLRVVDLGCGNAYLTFAAHRYLTAVRGLPVHVTGLDLKAQSVARNTALADQLGIASSTEFIKAPIGAAALSLPPDVVLALHACDTATDDALAAAVTWDAPLVLAAPCCHHDIAAQLRRTPAPAPYSLLTRDGIVRERFADTLTDALRAAVLRLLGYQVDVVEFVESRHTPRNTLLRARRTGSRPPAEAREELDRLTSSWGVRPRLTDLLEDRLAEVVHD